MLWFLQTQTHPDLYSDHYYLLHILICNYIHCLLIFPSTAGGVTYSHSLVIPKMVGTGPGTQQTLFVSQEMFK